MLTRSVLKVPAVSDATKKEVTKIVRKESALLCSKRSLLQMMSVEDLLRFRWSMFAREEAHETLGSSTDVTPDPEKPLCTFTIVGDNEDKNIKPRDM